MLGLTRAEFAVLRRLRTPEKIQQFLYGLKQNFERDGETCHSVRIVLRDRRAHCIEGAVVAACALWIHGEPPLLLDLKASRDYDHVVALFRRGRHWGAISKTNPPVLRYRDPVYRTLRELAMSYFHEYANRRHQKTLRSWAGPFDLRALDPKLWVANESHRESIVVTTLQLPDLEELKLSTDKCHQTAEWSSGYNSRIQNQTALTIWQSSYLTRN